ncbi:FMN-binding protein [Bariatricus sp. SGI.154]|uniref:FMN-binding protein n=1 Tax=Bariatricus sp. SGI.154 TaxID=3420549 RepID=UPI003D02233B
MKTFWVRCVSCVAIAALLGGYNLVIEAREKEDQVARLSAELAIMKGDAADAGEGDADSVEYQDGAYTGEADGFGGPISVKVTIDGGKIGQIQILSADNEDGAYLSMAQDIIPAIIDAQSTEVDTISGATFSSTGIKNAAAQALEEAAK